MEGGELFQRIQDHNEGAFTERGKYDIFVNSDIPFGCCSLQPMR